MRRASTRSAYAFNEWVYDGPKGGLVKTLALFAAVLAFADVGCAAIVRYENNEPGAPGSFQWRISMGFAAGDMFSPLLQPASNPVAIPVPPTPLPRGIAQWMHFGPGGSYNVILGYMQGFSGIQLARDPIRRLVQTDARPWAPTFREVDVPRVFAPGSLIDSNALFDTRALYCRSFGYNETIQGAGNVNLLGTDTPYLGFAADLPDGRHYGWIQFRWMFTNYPDNAYPPFSEAGDAITFQPIAWAFESMPGVAIQVPSTGTCGLALLACVTVLRRRRTPV